MLRRCLLLSLAVLAAFPALAAAQARDGLSTKVLYETGPSGRFLMGGTWLQRLDPGDDGVRQGFTTSASTAGWNEVTVPYAWNAADRTEASFAGGVGWYRKDFHLPSAASRYTWVLRFESVNYRAKVYLNGKLIGANTGAYLPWEVRIPASALERAGLNRLAVRVDSRRFPTDFPPSGLSTTGAPTGGWWNYSGILREVYLRQVDGVDLTSVKVTPDLPNANGAATVTWRATLRNPGGRSELVRVSARLGARDISLGTVSVPGGGFASVTKSVRVADPRVWSPTSPYLYDTSVTARVGARVAQRYTVKTGIRSIEVVDGRLLLNGQPLNFRGFGVHEDSQDKGFAIDDAQREQQIQWAREAGALLIRSHYPLHPYWYERLDELGMIAWVEVPVYAVKTQYLKREVVRKLAARELETAVRTNWNHPSIINWSIGNELSSRPGPVQGDYIKRAVTAAKTLDPSRPVGYAVAGYPAAGCQAEYAPLDILGINEYFGWYTGPNGQIADRNLLSEYLDTVRACYPKKAIVITEFGAEANRDGPTEEKGTYQFQQDFVNFHTAVYASKPWLSGAIWWTLQEFYVRPRWEGGNPYPLPNLHQKAVIRLDGTKKPAFTDLQRAYKATVQYPGVGGGT